MPSASLSHILLFAESRDDAAHLASVVAAIAESTPTWDRRVRRDGTETDAATVDLGGQRIEVHVGTPALPAVVELQVQDLAAAGERLLDAGHCYTQWPRLGPVERLHVTCGDVVVVIEAVDAVEYDVTAAVSGSSIAVRFTSDCDDAGLRVPRRVYLNTGADLAEQVEALLRDQPAGLRSAVLAAAEAAQS